MDRRSFLAASAAAAVWPRVLAAAPPALIPAAAMRADTLLLAEACTQLHPGLERYLKPGAFRAGAEELARGIEGELAPAEAYLKLSRLVAGLRCGHSWLNPVNQSRSMRTALFDGMRGLPFAFRWRGRRMIVAGLLRDDVPLEAGAEVVAIDGAPVATLLDRMLPLARADGHNQAKRIAQLEVDGRGRYPSFEVYRHLLVPASGQLVRLEIRGRGGRPLRLEAPTVDPTVARAESGQGLPWSFATADGIGTLRMPSWALYDSKWDWRAFLDRAVAELVDGRARGLIVDLRGNEGGLDCGNALLARLIERPLALPAYERRVRYRRVPDRLAPFLDTWDPSFKDWGAAAAGPDRNGFYRLASDGDDRRILPIGPRFAGRLAVLVDASCSSATFQFAQAVQEAGLGVLVGEPTGGNLRGINGGAFFFLRLPETGLEVDLPLIGYFPDRQRPDAGLQPDLPVALSRDDLARRRDRPYEAALRALA